MLIKKLSAIAALSGLCTMASTGFADDTAELKELLLKQQKQLEALQQKVEKQETVHNEALTHYIKNEIDRALEAKGSSLLTLGSHVENLTIKGDLRLRYEATESDVNTSRDRFRIRFRLGFVWKTSEGWEVGAGLATGENGASSATSTNQTVSSAGDFQTNNINLDYAYAKHKWDNGFSLTMGQHKNPFVSSSLLWDSDVRFVGITGQYADESGLFATAGGYVVRSYANATADNDDANLLAAQVGYEGDGLTAALTYYHFDSATVNNNLASITDDDYEVRLASGYVEYAGKTDSFKYKVFGEYTINIGADNDGGSQVTLDAGPKSIDAEDNDVAWIIGGEIGVDKFKFKYAYGHVEADSVYGPLSNSDFATAIDDNNNSANGEGHIFGLGYKVTKNFEIAATYILTEEIESQTGSGNDEGELFQLDFKYKF